MAKRLFAFSTSRWSFGIIWLLITICHIALLYFWFGLPISVAVADSAIHNILLAWTIIGMSQYFAYYRPVRGRYLFLVSVSAALSAIWVVLCSWILGKIFAMDLYYLEWLNNSMPIFFVYCWILNLSMGLLSTFWYEMQEKQEALARKETNEKMAREAELYKLRQQLQPHFLFNSLNSINALIAMRPMEAREMITKLSEFLRGTLKKEDQQWVKFEDEIQYLTLYLDIEKVRFRHRLKTVIEFPPEASTMLVPPMILQPVVENAIKFGLYDTTGEITISIQATVAEKALSVHITNPFDEQLHKSTQKGTGFGLKSIDRRLYLLFARNDLLNTQIHDNLFTTTIKIPQP